MPVVKEGALCLGVNDEPRAVVCQADDGATRGPSPHSRSRLAVRGSRFAVRGSRFAVRGSRLAARGSPFAVHDEAPTGSYTPCRDATATRTILTTRTAAPWTPGANCDPTGMGMGMGSRHRYGTSE